MFRNKTKTSSAASSTLGHFTIARMMVIAGIVIIATVTISSLYNRHAFIQNRIGSTDFSAIISGHDLVADYLPPPLLPMKH